MKLSDHAHQLILWSSGQKIFCQTWGWKFETRWRHSQEERRLASVGLVIPFVGVAGILLATCRRTIGWQSLCLKGKLQSVLTHYLAWDACLAIFGGSDRSLKSRTKLGSQDGWFCSRTTTMKPNWKGMEAILLKWTIYEWIANIARIRGTSGWLRVRWSPGKPRNADFNLKP